MIKIYHNPRCSKSRQGLAILEEAKVSFETIKYLDNPPTREELVDILNKLAIKPINLIRKGEAVWKKKFEGKELNDTEIIDAMVSYPKLIERPIVITNDNAVIGRPPEQIKILL